MKIRYWLLADPRFTARDNEGAGESGSEDGAGDTSGDAAAQAAADAAAQAAAAAAAAGGDEQTFTQTQLNDIVIKRNKKVKAQLETAEATMTKLLEAKNLSDQERAGIKTQLEELQGQMRTKEQQLAYEGQQKQAEYTARLEETSGQLDFYKNQFETQTRTNAILAAATKHEAYNPEQFVDLLSNRTEIVAEANEQGEKTGRLVPRIRMQVTAEDGTVSEVPKTPEEAVALMKENVQTYGNLFRGNVAKGIGEGSNPAMNSGAAVDVTKMTDAEYFANRDKFKDRLGLPDRRR